MHSGWARRLGGPLALSDHHNWKEGKGNGEDRKMQRALFDPPEHNVSVDVGQRGRDAYLLLTFTAVKALLFFLFFLCSLMISLEKMPC